MRKLWTIGAIGVAAAAIAVFVACATASKPRPVGRSGPEADALAQRMLDQVNASAWADTKAVTWNFRGKRTHLWDRERNFELYRKDDLEVLLRLDDHTGIATKAGQTLAGEDADKALKSAWEAWVNDSFWLNAPTKCFDPGTERMLVHDKKGEHLFVAYTSGGVTPGDGYLWDFGTDRPSEWHMWTHVIPIGGASASWDGWEQLPTGAWISTKHKLATGTLELTDVRGAATLAELVPGTDPFAALDATH